MSDDRRVRRVAESIRAHLSSALITELGDATLSSLVVTRVEVPADFSVAWVYVRELAGAGDERAQARLLGRLSAASSRLRRRIGSELRLRRLPELRFKYDIGQEAHFRVHELLREIADDQKQHASDEDETMLSKSEPGRRAGPSGG